MTLQPIPRSKAKTAWGLCADVCRAMLQDPKRVDMHFFTTHRLPIDGGPACGTVGCIAGWITLLATGTGSDDHKAQLILGNNLNYYTADTCGGDLFASGYRDSAIFNGVHGSRPYATSVVKRLRRFMRMNEAALRARKLDGSYGTYST